MGVCELNITEKSDVCATANCFVYGAGGAGPHALTSIVGTYNGVTNPTFTYDANGLMTAGAGRTVTPTAFNMAASIVDGSNSAAVSYDSERARYKMVAAGLNAGTTYYLNEAASGAMEEKFIAGGTTTWRDYILADGRYVAERFCTGAAPCTTGASVNYFVLDHLGSIAVIVSSTGSVLNRLGYDAWGKRRKANGTVIDCVAGTSPPSGVTRGFTGQEMIDGVCLVNMNARVYDPSIGRFMSADPTVGDDTIPQELNRYSYVLDNPLSLTDPSGLCFLGCFWRDAWFRELFGLAIAFVLPEELAVLEGYESIQTVPGILAVVDAGITGGVSGIVSTGTLKGAALGALEAGLFAEAGNVLKPQSAKGFFGIGYKPSEFIAHGLVGGLASELGGGKFGSGFLAGAIASFSPTPTAGQSWEDTFEGTVESATLGGVGSILGGGKFQNGAVTGAFAYLFNAAAHSSAGGDPSDPLGCAGGQLCRQEVTAFGDANSSMWAIQYNLTGPAPLGGYIVQNVTMIDPNSGFLLSYWEAWHVSAGNLLTDLSDYGSSYDDVFSSPSTTIIFGTSRYYDGLFQLPSTFVPGYLPGGVREAGDLPSTTVNPNLPTTYATPAVFRALWH